MSDVLQLGFLETLPHLDLESLLSSQGRRYNLRPSESGMPVSMPSTPDMKPSRSLRAGRRLFLIFSATVLAPGLVLGVFGLRALTRERQDVERQVRERFNAVAENIGRRLELELRDWQQAAEDLAPRGSQDPALWPERVRKAVAQPGGAVVLLGSGETVQAYPDGQLLYALSATPEAPRGETPASLEEAESLELRSKQFDRAIDLYRQRTTSAEPGERAHALNGLARTLAKAGRVEEALSAYRLLAKEQPVRIGSYPSDALALFRSASLEEGTKRAEDALTLFRGLVDGRWRFDAVTYADYSNKVRAWLPENSETLRLTAIEDKKRSLTLAAERFLASRRPLDLEDGKAALAFWHAEPFAAIVLGPSFLEEYLRRASDDGDLEVRLGGAFTSEEPAGAYTLQSPGFPIGLQVRSRNPAALFAGVTRQQNLYLAVLAFLVALLGVGGYFTIRTMRSELAVAQMKADFVSTVSHEFRSPLAGINQLGEMLRDGRVDDDNRRQEYYEMIVAETQRLRRLVENVLDFARMEDGRKQYRFEPVEPTVWLHEVAEDFQAEVAGRGFAVEAHIPEALPPIVADRETLTTAVHNLLDNAVKYSRDSRHVRLEACSNGDGLSISICDRGAGIREEDRPRIFEKFYRGGGELARQVKGVGLGLNLVQHIVAAHGGTIEVASKEGEGSTFTIHLKTGERSA
jgi:signal transduction histidine kinase